MISQAQKTLDALIVAAHDEVARPEGYRQNDAVRLIVKRAKAGCGRITPEMERLAKVGAEFELKRITGGGF